MKEISSPNRLTALLVMRYKAAETRLKCIPRKIARGTIQCLSREKSFSPTLGTAVECPVQRNLNCESINFQASDVWLRPSAAPSLLELVFRVDLDASASGLWCLDLPLEVLLKGHLNQLLLNFKGCTKSRKSRNLARGYLTAAAKIKKFITTR